MDVKSPVFTYSQKSGDHYTFFVLYEVEVVSGEVNLSDEHTDFRWVTKEEALEMDLEPVIRAYFEQIG